MKGKSGVVVVKEKKIAKENVEVAEKTHASSDSAANPPPAQRTVTQFPRQGGKVVAGKAKELVIVLNRDDTNEVAGKPKNQRVTRRSVSSKNTGVAPLDQVPIKLEPHSDEESDASDASMETVTSTCSMASQGTKRPRDSGSDEDTLTSGSEEKEKRPKAPGPTLSVARRGRGRPPTNGKFVGLHKAKRKKKEEEWRAQKRQAEQELVEDSRDILRSSGVAVQTPITAEEDGADATADDLSQQINKSVKYIREVVRKSKNMKGELQGGIKIATQTIANAAAILATRSVAEETKALQAQNARQQSELEAMRKDVEQLRAALREVQAPPPAAQSLDVEALERSIMLKVGTLVDARVAGRLLPEPILRPPLAFDRRRAAEAARQGTSSEVPTTTPTPMSTETTNRVAKPATQPASYARVAAAPVSAVAVMAPARGKSRSRSSAPRSESPQAAEPPRTASIAPAQASVQGPSAKRKKKKRKTKQNMAARRVEDAEREEMAAIPINPNEWTRVRSKKAARNERTQSKGRNNQKRETPSKPKPQKLRVPRTAAVVLTLHPEATETGVTYETVMVEAKKHLSMKELGIADVRFRYTATGAPLMVFPGAGSAQTADKFAEKLRGVVDPSLVRVSRPEKMAEMRLTDLEASITCSEVIAAIAEEGQCDPSSVTCGNIRRDYPRRPGTAWVRCPVTAAKRLAAKKRLLIGWSSARIEVLPERPLRCYKCQGSGHAKACCHTDVDRSNECLRCGQPGHKANTCLAKPHCTVCAAAGRKADHMPGRRTCTAPKARNEALTVATKAPQPAMPGPSSARGPAEEEPMETR